MAMSRILAAGRAATCAAAIAVGAMFASGVAYGANGAGSADAENPIVVYTRDSAATSPGGAADQLIARAEAKGQIFVIVMLRTIMRMEHTLSSSDVAAQHRMLNDIQSRVAQRVLGSASALSESDRFTLIPAMAMTVNAAQLRRLLNDPEVVSVTEDIPLHPSLEDSLPLIHATDLFKAPINVNGTGRFVAILDTGVDRTHDMLKTKVKYEACFSTQSPPALRTLCPNGREVDVGPGAAAPCPLAGCDHGTHVASIAAGNSAALDGVARDSKILAFMVFSRTSANKLDGRNRDIIAALTRVHSLRNTYKIAAVNLSLGGGKFAGPCDGPYAGVKAAIDNLNAVGIPTIISSGNQGYVNEINGPACISSAIAVGNTTKADLLWRSSNHSPLVKLLAPGTQIKAAIPTPAKYGLKTGTSMAAPHVAGAFALLKNAKPAAAPGDILQALTCTGKPIYQGVPRPPAPGPFAASPIKPRIDLLGAFNFLKRPPGVVRTWNFNNLTDQKDWAPFAGEWKTVGGFYRPTSRSIWVESSVANCDTKLDITARIRRVDPTPKDPVNPLHTTQWNSGVWIKTTLDANAHTLSGYFFAFNAVYWCTKPPPPTDPNYKCTSPATIKRGQGVIYRLTQSNYDTGRVTAGVQLCFKNTPITVGGFNTLRIVSNGSNHRFFLNGVLVCSVVDATFVTGPVVLAAAIPCDALDGCPTSEDGHLLQVDSISIKTLDTAAPTIAKEETIMDPAASASIIEGVSAERAYIPGVSQVTSLTD